VISCTDGIDAAGTVTGNNVRGNGPTDPLQGSGLGIIEGSTVIGNTATNAFVGILVSCPSSVTDNTAVTNLVLFGTPDCNNTNNVAP
jgi:hypothetical protein